MAQPMIIVIEDDPVQRKLIRGNLEAKGYAVLEASSGREAKDLVARNPVEVAIVDYRLAGETGLDVIETILAENPLVTPVMVTAYGNIERAVEAIKRGAYDFIVKPLDFEKFLLVLERARERYKLQKEISELKERLEEKFSSRNFVFNSKPMEEVVRLIVKAARSDATVVISGETGTGKDLVARTIHYSSRRKDGPFLAVNVPSLPESLLESELFGSEKGAFTGALERKPGKFEAASGGTLLLDEIGDMPVHLQAKILHVLQNREFFRLGSSRPEPLDVRIIAATNRDLDKLTREGKFRADLFYRLNVINIHIPPLRTRKEDIPLLADFFVKKFARREGKAIAGISREAMTALVGYPYPGNVRELENIIERAVVFAEGETIVVRDLPIGLFEQEGAAIEPEGSSLRAKVRTLETSEIRRALHENGNVKSRAAKALGITERMLAYKMKIYKI